MEIKNSISQIESTLLNVRKAYRLIYTYQRRVMDIMQFIGHLTSRRYEGGWSKFSNSSPKDGKGTLDLWAWDWLNMYCYEFYFGEKVIDGNAIGLSVWLVSDTGYYDAESDEPLNLDSFSKVGSSITKLVFVIGKNIWHNDLDDFWENARKDVTEYVKRDNNEILIAKSFELSRFLNSDEARRCLQELVIFCQANDILEMTIVE